jgi:phosphoserine phosphatase RsbU/P
MSDPDRLAAVRRSGLIGSAREPVFNELAKAAAQILRTKYALISVLDDELSFWKATYGLAPDTRVESVADSFCQYVVEREQELFTADVRLNEITRANPSIERKDLRAWAGYPVELDGEILGTLCVMDNQRREWTADDRTVLQSLAALASREIALRVQLAEAEQSAERATTETMRIHALLATIRSSLLPPTLPVIDGLELEGWFAAADDSDLLLGDFYDVFPLEERRWGLVVGDVCGHGAEAAKLTSLVRYSLRSAAARTNDPAEVLGEVDRAIRNDATDPGRFATVCYLIVDTRTGCSIRWARAGHPHPIIVSASGTVQICHGADGPPLGLQSGPSGWSVSEFDLNDGDRLLVHTDGLTDVRSTATQQQLGEDGLIAVLHDMSNDPVGRVGSLIAYVTSKIEPDLWAREDDIALIALSAQKSPTN